VGGALSAIGGLFFKEGPGGARTGADRGALSARLGPGRPLDSAARTRMETAFGQSFGTVRVHDDTGAAGLARDLGAQAFTLGTHVAFAGGTYRPGTPVGDALLAHELAHVVQQGGEAAAPQAPAPDPLGKRQVPDAAVEEEADQAAAGALASLYAPGVQPPPWRPRRRGGVRLSRCAEAQPPESKVPAPGAKAPAESKVPAPAGSMAPPEAEEPAPPAAEETQIDWMVVLPEASAEKPGRRVEKADNATGPLTRFELDRSGGSPEPTFRYRTDVGAISDGEQLLGDKDKIDAARAAVAQIERARDAIPQRFFVVRDTPTQMGTFAGFERSAAKNVTDKIAAEGSADERRADADYAAWLKKRKGAGMGGFATFEGDPSSMQAADKANLTIGPGLAASGGVFQRVLKAVMDKSPEARQAFFAAGISMTAKTEVGRGDFQLVVVDTDKKWKLVSTDAELYLRANSRLLSLFVNVAQGFLHGLGPDAPVSEEARMAVFEAELAEVKRTKGGLDEKWFTDAEAFTLAARGVHSGKFPASSFKPASPGTTLSTADVVAILQTKFRQEQIDSMLKNIRNVR
jgi:hypothetical protein